MDTLSLDFDSQFDLITCLGFVMYLREESFPDFLSRIYRSLKLGGRLLLSFYPEASEHSKLIPFDATRMEAVDREFRMCTEVRYTTRHPLPVCCVTFRKTASCASQLTADHIISAINRGI